MKERSFLAVVCVLWVWIVGAQETAKSSEPPALEGAWALATYQENGKTEAFDYSGTYRLLVAGDTWALRWVGDPGSIGTSRMRFTLDLGKTPKEIGFVLSGPEKKPMLGIYSIQGGRLTVCYAPPGGKRPAAFRTVPGDGLRLLTFERDAREPVTSNTLLAFLKEQFSVTLPKAAKVANFATKADPINHRRPGHEVFAEIVLEPDAYKVFRRRLLYDKERPEGQRIMWEGQERPPMIGGIPGPFSVPRSARWWDKNGADTLCVLLHEQYHPDLFHGGAGAYTETTKAVVMFLSERQGRVMLWAFVPEPKSKEPKPKESADKKEGGTTKAAKPPRAKSVELQGVLKVGAPPPVPNLGAAARFVVADPKVALTGVTVVIDMIGSVDIELPDDRLKALAKELNGRMVAVTGELRRIAVIPPSYRAAISGIELQDDRGRTIWVPLGGDMPGERLILRATSLKAAGPKPAPMSGEPSIKNPFGGKERLSTFKRLPRAADVTAMRIAPRPNRTKQRLTAANFPALLDSLAPVKADDPKYKTWHYADWYHVEFETSEGRYMATLYLGGLGLLSAPDGSLGLVTFNHPK
jgi:uncharacterized protein (TIGR03067 family)